MAGSGSTCPTVVVDMREFGSQLPSVLHKKGVRLVPVTLEVGDYILSPEICVERKSIPDLHQSLSSGRLYAQAESMCKHYKTACLLIEFDPDKSFALVSQRDLLDDISSKSILSRLCLLILHFPRLRLLWSRGPHSTADLFLSLKSKNQEEPDPGVAALVGLHNALGAGGGGGAGVTSNAAGAGSLFLSAAASREWLVNEPAQALLRRMPGVTEGNVRGLMSELGSLRGVADASLEDLQRIMGGGRNAQILFDFLHTR